MSGTINLRTARKQRKRADSRAAATAQAAASGEGATSKRLRAANDALAQARLSQHRLDANRRPDPPEDA